MGYRVRNAEGDGELFFEQLADLEKAYRAKLVDPEDELRADGEDHWTRVGAVAVLRGSRPEVRVPSETKRWYLAALGIVAGTVAATWAARLLARHLGVGPWAVVLPAVVIVLGVGLTQMSARAFRSKASKRPGPYGR